MAKIKKERLLGPPRSSVLSLDYFARLKRKFGLIYLDTYTGEQIEVKSFKDAERVDDLIRYGHLLVIKTRWR